MWGGNVVKSEILVMEGVGINIYFRYYIDTG